MRVPGADAEGIAISRGASDAPHTDAAVRAGYVLDNDGLPERQPHALGHDASTSIHCRTRRRDDEERRSFIELVAAVFDGAALLGVERGEVGCGHCGQATPETAARPKDRFPGAILRVAPNHEV